MLTLSCVAASALSPSTRCIFKSEAHSATFDLSPLATEHEIKFDSGLGNLLADFPGFVSGPQQSLVLSVCGPDAPGEFSTCHGEHAPGILVERTPPRSPGPFGDPILAAFLGGGAGARPAEPARTACAVLGRPPAKPEVVLLDADRPERGLQLIFGKGDECRPGQRYSLLLMLECNLAEHGLGSQIPARVQTRHHCEWVVSISTAAACPVNVGALCAPNCPRNWLGDGECDPGCDSEACGHDGGDCDARSRTNAAAAQCAPGCVESWRGDKECDEECNTARCGFDGDDCTGDCAPACAAAWLGDGVCDDECNTGTCRWDGGDCLRDGQPVARERCAWGCPGSWLADGQCDIGCNVTACGFDRGDCVAAWKHDGASRGSEEGDGRVGKSLAAPQTVVMEARVGGVHFSAQVDNQTVMSAFGAGFLLLLCTCAALWGVVCWVAVEQRRRYESYEVVGGVRAGETLPLQPASPRAASSSRPASPIRFWKE